MNLTDISASTVQAFAWKKENQKIPEEHLNEIIECALNMPCTSLSRFNTKPWSVWVPHREGLLDDALSCAATWSPDCVQDTFFRNAKTVLVYIMKEPKHIKNGKLHENSDQNSADMSYAGLDDPMDQIVKKDWINTKKNLDKQMAEEQDKKSNNRFNDPPSWSHPFWNWHADHIAQLGINVGLAMGAVTLKARELGYWHQFHTVFRQTTTWHTRFGNKFNEDGKWWPYAIQIIGTKPAGAKVNSRATKPDVTSEAHTVEFGERSDKQLKEIQEKKYSVLNNYLGDQADFPVLRGWSYRTFKKSLPDTLPDNLIRFFMDHYGKYSTNPKELFKHAFGSRTEGWEEKFDNWMAKNN
jgi:hypothetical protein